MALTRGHVASGMLLHLGGRGAALLQLARHGVPLGALLLDALLQRAVAQRRQLVFAPEERRVEGRRQLVHPRRELGGGALALLVQQAKGETDVPRGGAPDFLVRPGGCGLVGRDLQGERGWYGQHTCARHQRLVRRNATHAVKFFDAERPSKVDTVGFSPTDESA